MPRPHKIWAWKSRDEWCVRFNRVRHRLGPDKVEAERRFHELMLKRPEKPVTPDAVALIIDNLLKWTEPHRERGLFEWDQGHLHAFLDVLADQSFLVGVSAYPK